MGDNTNSGEQMIKGGPNPRRTEILTRKHRGETFKEIHRSYPKIKYGTLVEIARDARERSRVWIDEKGVSPSEVCNHLGISRDCLDEMLAQERERHGKMLEEYERKAREQEEERLEIEAMLADESYVDPSTWPSMVPPDLALALDSIAQYRSAPASSDIWAVMKEWLENNSVRVPQHFSKP